MKVKIRLSDVPLYEFHQPTYSYETYYKYRNQTGNRWSNFNQRVRKERRVLTGQVEKTVFAPTAKVEFEFDKENLLLEDGMLYWHSLTYDQEKSRYKNFRSAEAWKRMWPFGIKGKYYEFEYLANPYPMY